MCFREEERLRAYLNRVTSKTSQCVGIKVEMIEARKASLFSSRQYGGGGSFGRVSSSKVSLRNTLLLPETTTNNFFDFSLLSSRAAGGGGVGSG